MKPRLLFVGVVLWLGVVLVGSAITWLVIDQVGRHVVTEMQPGEDTPVAPGPSAVAPSDAGVTPPPGSAPSTSRTSEPGPSGGQTPQAQSPQAQSPQAQTPQARAVTRTWSGAGGRVTVSCTGADARLVSASPADGWRVDVGSRGPGEVQVELKHFADEGVESQVRSRCNGGEPKFVVGQND